MARKSTISRLPPEQRAFIEKLLREDRLTLDEMLVEIRAAFPQASPPSRSTLGRYSKQFDVLAGRLRDIQAASKVLVSELGEDATERGGQLLVEAITTLATDAALRANDEDAAPSIKEVAELARGARAVLQARTASLKERQAIEKAAIERMRSEQQKKLGKLERDGAITPEVLARIREEIYGL